ncbi:MAG: phosphoribosylamine--glycine ligase, partial [Deltaproteobacteria bacterium]|nr:phosphoribosylamine--glycine ligase [Deltaproteobacteria bacterium]
LAALHILMRERKFGNAGSRVVIEERLVGREISYHVLSDGRRFLPIGVAQDHKRLEDGDRGPNTGGMGAYSPVPFVHQELEEKITKEIVEPLLHGMRLKGIPYTGVLFVGIMVVGDQPYVLEFNVRFGDPEAQVLMRRWRDDVYPFFEKAAGGDLGEMRLELDASSAVAVVLASEGYPDAPRTGQKIDGIEEAEQEVGVCVFHAGTRRREDGSFESAGGRVLTVTGMGMDLEAAIECAYRGVSRIRFEGMRYRKDIGAQGRCVGFGLH